MSLVRSLRIEGQDAELLQLAEKGFAPYARLLMKRDLQRLDELQCLARHAKGPSLVSWPWKPGWQPNKDRQSGNQQPEMGAPIGTVSCASSHPKADEFPQGRP